MSRGSDEVGRESWRAAMVAFAVAATAICVGGAVAVVAVERGVPMPVALLLMAVVIVSGVVAASLVVLRAWPGETETVDARTVVDQLPRVRSRGIRRADRAHRRAVRRIATMDPTLVIEQKLSARYGVPVKRVASHVWRINGELVEATWDPSTGHLVAGGRELTL